MDFLNIIFQTILERIDLSIIVLIIAIGELVKKYWKSRRVKSFFKILVPTLFFTLVYCYYRGVKEDVFILSYLLAFWLYPFLVKPLLKALGLQKEKTNI